MKIERVKDDWYRVTISVRGKKVTMFAYSRKEAWGKAKAFLRQQGESYDQLPNCV